MILLIVMFEMLVLGFYKSQSQLAEYTAFGILPVALQSGHNKKKK